MVKKIYNYCRTNKNYRLTIFWDNNGKFILLSKTELKFNCKNSKL
jgi:hypothetical protein